MQGLFHVTQQRLMAGAAAIVIAASAAPAQAQQTRTFDVPAGPAARTIPIFAKQAGVQIIGSADTLKSKRTNSLKGRFTVEEGLRRLLGGTDLGPTARNNGVITIGLVRRGNESAPEGDGANNVTGVSEILVIGSRSRNVDVRRTEDDAQPYVVFDREEVVASQATTVEEFLRTRLPQNAGIFGAQSQESGNGAPFSRFNLRGLGANQTLILVNGRRLPVLNNRTEAPAQADINGIPIGSIERIEVLPSSAGGIYGGNAVGGVINIVLRSDYRGVDITATYNDSFDFHAPSGRIDINGGFALEGGRTTITFGGSIARSGTLRVGDRAGLLQDGLDLYRRNIDITAGTGSPPIGNGVNIRSATSADLVLKPQFGGTALGSRFTNVPLGYAGVGSDNGAQLVANAGTFNLDIPDDLLGLRRGLLTSPAISSGNVAVRRKFSDRFEAFVDYSHLENKGTSYSASQLTNAVTLSAASPYNPFQQNIRVTYPLPGISFPYRSESKTDTLSAGAIIRLPYDWGVNVEYSKTWTRTTTVGYGKVVPDAIQACLTSGAATCGGGPALNPIQSPIDFGPYLYPDPTILNGPFRSTFDNPSLRAAGPLFKLPGGKATLTLAVQREETGIKQSVSETTDGTVDGRYYTFVLPRKQRTTSFYGEMVLPLVSPQNDVPFVRELELRGAVRRDSYYTEAPPAGFSYIDYMLGGVSYTIPGGLESVSSSNPDVEIPSYSAATSRFASTNYTLAGRYSPFEGVVFRGSYATGFLPPSVTQIASQTLENPFGLGIEDPLRGNEFIFYPLTQTQGLGNATLKPEKSTTLSAGVILTPFEGFRFSADYTRIRKEDEIGGIPTPFLLANPDLFPGRVTRGPASDGFAVGQITSIDLTPINLLRSQVQAVDFQLDYTLRTEKLGQFRFYGVATWQPDTVRQFIINAPSANYSGNLDGPLKWQGNVGVDWTMGRVSVRWNTQFYDSYTVYLTDDDAGQRDFRITAQGAEKVPSQMYSDVYASYDFKDAAGPLNGVRISAGIQNLFDKKPPVIAVSGFFAAPYSTYGDPRLRRFSISLRKSFGNK